MDQHTYEPEGPSLKISREQGVFDKSLVIRALIILLFFACFFCLLHFREVHVDVLELNSSAPSYMVAQVDFDFFDEEATIIARQDAIRDFGKIFMIDEKMINERRMEFENFLIYNQDWGKYVEKNTFDGIYKGVNAIVQLMQQVRFTDSRTFQILTEMGMPTHHFLIYTPTEISNEIYLPQQIWEYVKDNALKTKLFDNATAAFVINYFQDRRWWIDEDVQLRRTLTRKIQASIPDKYTHVNAGSRLIDKGEKVTARHVAMIQAMKKALNDKRNLWHFIPVLGSLILAGILTILCAAYFKVSQPEVAQSNQKLFLLVTIVLLSFLIAKGTELILLNTKANLIDIIRYPIFVAFPSILLGALMNPPIALFTSAFLTVIFTLTLAFNWQGFMLMNLAAGMVAVLCTPSLKKRKGVFAVCLKAWLCCIGIILAIHFYNNHLWGWSFFSDFFSTGISLLLTGVLVVGLLPLLESAFKIMTDVTLTEYLDPNNDLLRRLSIEAPGTYQHSVVVGNLAEAAASSIGANALFCRVATLYHDVGKMATPQYFTENQQGSVNIHQLLTPQESAQVIMAHVCEGVSMARKAGLPEQFIDIIKEHHGTTLVYYFYRKQLEKVGGDKSLVDESEFRYSGPKPRSKESAIIMIADTVEAASRSLDQMTEEALTELANRLIREKAEDGQFDECLLTFEELAIVKRTLVKTLVAFGHTRVKYPKQEAPKEIVLDSEG
ncbi:MAG TPA: HDIG domain-containing protein [Parachlamydiaceae bacterium]|nr:HDIG domain-containing protein [Parachlamydiaceae bacterium]